jgi:hypothetical protein
VTGIPQAIPSSGRSSPSLPLAERYAAAHEIVIDADGWLMTLDRAARDQGRGRSSAAWCRVIPAQDMVSGDNLAPT